MNKVAIITGATSGFGEVFSYRLGEMGYDLIIIGRRESQLNKMAKDIKSKYDIKVKVKILDLSDERLLDEFIDELDNVENIEFLVNNAGHGAMDSFTRDSYKNQEEMLNVHVLATMKLCHKVSNKMKIDKKGFIINVSSLASFNSFPSSAMYCSTKSFLTSFSQCLAMELNKDNIRVQALCPGFARTSFHANLHMDESKLKNKGIVRWMSAEEVVDYSLKKIKREMKVIVIPGLGNRIVYQLLKFIPKSIYYKFAVKSWELME